MAFAVIWLLKSLQYAALITNPITAASLALSLSLSLSLSLARSLCLSLALALSECVFCVYSSALSPTVLWFNEMCTVSTVWMPEEMGESKG